jgi:aquaporin Z
MCCGLAAAALSAPGTALGGWLSYPLAVNAFVIAFYAGPIALMIASPVGAVSGAQMNPQVSLALLLSRRHSVLQFLSFFVAQCLAAMAAAKLVSMLAAQIGSTAPHIAKLPQNLGVTLPAEGLPVWSAFAAEVLGSFGLSLLILLLVRRGIGMASLALWVGAYLFIACQLAAPFSGGSFNPARSLGPALAAGELSWLWLYFAAPLAGAALAAWIDAATSRNSAGRPTDADRP